MLEKGAPTTGKEHIIELTGKMVNSSNLYGVLSSLGIAKRWTLFIYIIHTLMGVRYIVTRAALKQTDRNEAAIQLSSKILKWTLFNKAVLFLL